MAPARRVPGSTSNWLRAAIAALLFGFAALGVAAIAGLEIAPPEAWASGQVTRATVFVGVALCAFPIWRRLAGRRRRSSLLLGAAIGVLVAIASYPMTLVLAELGRTVVAGPVGFLERLWHAIEISAFLLVTTGLVAVAALAIVGALLAWLLPNAPGPAVPGEERRARRWPIVGTAIVLLLAGAFAVLSLLPAGEERLASLPTAAPAEDYGEAIKRIDAVAAEEMHEPLDPRCRSALLTHGSRTATAVVYLHGLTTCPAQGDELARQLFDRGYNVYVPRFPGHGYADRMTDALVSVTAEDILDTASGAAAIASGLGEDVVVIGLSGGGSATMWIEHNQAGIARTVAIAPFLSPYGLPPWANRAAMNLLTILPNIMILWDPDDIEPIKGMEYAYPQIPTRLVAQFLRLTVSLDGQAAVGAPRGPAPGLLINDADQSVNNAMAEAVVASWTSHGATVDVRRIPASLGLLHDLIDPRQPDAQIDYAYPIIIEMIGRR